MNQDQKIKIRRVIEEVNGKATTRHYVGLCEEAGVWTEEELANAEYDYKASQFRKVAERPWEDDDGKRWEIVNIVISGAGADPKPEQVYLPFLHCTKAQKEQVILFHIKKGDHHYKRADDFLTTYGKEHGKKAERQLRLKYNRPAPEPATP